MDVTYEGFLKGVFGEMRKLAWTALKTLFSEIVTGQSTLVSDMSRPLHANASMAERKRSQGRVSGWLKNYDFVEAAGGWLLGNIFWGAARRLHVRRRLLGHRQGLRWGRHGGDGDGRRRRPRR